MPGFAFDNSYARLPARFFASQAPTPVAAPSLVKLNQPLAATLGLDAAALAGIEGAALLAGNSLPPGAEPIATAYAGHQFGGFSPQLGDGRAILLGELVGPDGLRHDIQLKGSGPTPYSRRGDGRAALGPVLREYLVSEAMAVLGIPTTRALAAVTTGESVRREALMPGAVLTRVASSHIRVGTFQYFAARRDVEGLRALADHAMARHYPEALEEAEPYRAFYKGVVARQASLVAQWMMVGFIHGVMNTDNTSIAGETIDYGPCAFMDGFDPATVFSSIDHGGRYAYGNQPPIAQWNLARLAEALMPLLGEDEESALAAARAGLAGFALHFEEAWLAGMRQKLGLTTEEEGDAALANDLLARMAESKADYTLTFRGLAASAGDARHDEAPGAFFAKPAAFTDWAGNWRARLSREAVAPEARAAAMRAVNPLYIPRNHLVEEALAAAVTAGNYAPFETLLDVLSRPFEEREGLERFTLPAPPSDQIFQTFCGT